jgi:hypothetical protein
MATSVRPTGASPESTRSRDRSSLCVKKRNPRFHLDRLPRPCVPTQCSTESLNGRLRVMR